jgi:Holliday junction DNA helicase RuvA
MIASLRGTVITSDLDHCVIETGDGVGYLVFITSDTASSIFDKENQPLFLHIHTIVREDALDLYGFESVAEKDLFQRIINVSGVGPKSGLAVLSIAPINQLRSAIASGDVGFLTKVSGIGKKSAQKIILELQDKLADEAMSSPEGAGDYAVDNEVLAALVALGYNEREARMVIKQIDSDITSTEDRLKSALKLLS